MNGTTLEWHLKQYLIAGNDPLDLAQMYLEKLTPDERKELEKEFLEHGDPDGDAMGKMMGSNE